MPAERPGTGLRLLLHTVVVTLVMTLITALCVQRMALAYGINLSDLGSELATVTARMHLRFILIVNNLGTYAIPALLAAYLTYRGQWLRRIGLRRVERPYLVTGAAGVFLFSLPLVTVAAYLNLQLDLPQWMLQNEEQVEALLNNVLRTDTGAELLVTLITVAVVPGFAEEVLFRGLLQGRLLPKIMSGHAAIWVSATLFSAIHLEFAGFLPRLLLGAALGYSYRWTGSLWIPIVLHMLFNGLQVLVAYYTGSGPVEGEIGENIGALAIPAVAGLAVIALLARRNERLLRRAGDAPL